MDKMLNIAHYTHKKCYMHRAVLLALLRIDGMHTAQHMLLLTPLP
jgi:hypothetical protein